MSKRARSATPASRSHRSRSAATCSAGAPTRPLRSRCSTRSSTTASTSSTPPTPIRAGCRATSGGESETIIGRWLKRSGKRDQVVIATKVAKWSQRKGLSPANIAGRRRRFAAPPRHRLHRCLLRARGRSAVPLEETLGAFARLIEAGKVRAIGASNYQRARGSPKRSRSARSTDCRATRSLQPEYNLVARKGYESRARAARRAARSLASSATTRSPAAS